MPVGIKIALIYIYLILIEIMIQVSGGKFLITVTVNELMLTVKLMVNKLGWPGLPLPGIVRNLNG